MNKLRGTVFLIVLALLSMLLIGCTSEVEKDIQNNVDENIEEGNYKVQVTDDIGNSITITEKPEKVISIAPSITEILFSIGAEDKVVGVSDYCDYPTEALEKEKVGDALAINIEKILELDPDVVFLYSESSTEAIDQIQDNGIHTIVYESETIDDIFSNILEIGRIMDVEENADEVVSEMKQKRDYIINKVKDTENVRVFYQIWDEPLMTAGQGSFIHELINLAGGENIAADVEDAYPQYSAESMIEKDPEVYIAPAHTAESEYLNSEEIEELRNNIKSRPGYDAMTAIKNDRIELLDPNIVSRPGVRIIEALELFAKAIHPEIFN